MPQGWRLDGAHSPARIRLPSCPRRSGGTLQGGLEEGREPRAGLDGQGSRRRQVRCVHEPRNADFPPRGPTSGRVDRVCQSGSEHCTASGWSASLLLRETTHPPPQRMSYLSTSPPGEFSPVFGPAHRPPHPRFDRRSPPRNDPACSPPLHSFSKRAASAKAWLAVAARAGASPPPAASPNLVPFRLLQVASRRAASPMLYTSSRPCH